MQAIGLITRAWRTEAAETASRVAMLGNRRGCPLVYHCGPNSLPDTWGHAVRRVIWTVPPPRDAAEWLSFCDVPQDLVIGWYGARDWLPPLTGIRFVLCPSAAVAKAARRAGATRVITASLLPTVPVFHKQPSIGPRLRLVLAWRRESRQAYRDGTLNGLQAAMRACPLVELTFLQEGPVGHVRSAAIRRLQRTLRAAYPDRVHVVVADSKAAAWRQIQVADASLCLDPRETTGMTAATSIMLGTPVICLEDESHPLVNRHNAVRVSQHVSGHVRAESLAATIESLQRSMLHRRELTLGCGLPPDREILSELLEAETALFKEEP